MKNRLFALFLTIVCIFGLLSCNNTNEVFVESLAVVEDSIPAEILSTEIDDKIDDIKIKVIKSDKTEEIINLDKSMISQADISKLASEGTHTITVTYEEKNTTITIVVKNPVDDRYSAKVVYPDNTPVTSGVSVQWCLGDMCLKPVTVDANGMAYIDVEDAQYFIHINNIPEGYIYNPNAYVANKDNKHVEIKLYSLLEATGDGSKDVPIVVTEGAYSIQFEELKTKGMKYFSFTAAEAGNYTIESLCVDKLAITTIDPYLGFAGTDINANPDITGNDVKDSINFKYQFAAEADTTYYFIIFVSEIIDGDMPCNVEFLISKA